MRLLVERRELLRRHVCSLPRRHCTSVPNPAPVVAGVCGTTAGGWMNTITFVFQGDWCDVSNNMACNDSIRLSGGFSASGVKSN